MASASRQTVSVWIIYDLGVFMIMIACQYSDVYFSLSADMFAQGVLELVCIWCVSVIAAFVKRHTCPIETDTHRSYSHHTWTRLICNAS